MSNLNPVNQLMDIAMRIRDMREILGYSMQKMAELSEELYFTVNGKEYRVTPEADAGHPDYTMKVRFVIPENKNRGIL